MAMKHVPTHDWIIAKKLHDPTADSMPLIHGVIRTHHQTPHAYAEVIAVGPGRANVQTGFAPALPCKVGDVVMIRAAAGDPESIEGVEYHWLIPDEVMAIVPRPSPLSLA